MKSAKIIAALILVMTSMMASYAAENGEVSAITAVVKTHITKETVEGVYLDKIIGSYAEAIVSVKDGEGGIAYLKKSGNTWSVMSYGNAISEAALVEFGVPQDIAKKLAE